MSTKTGRDRIKELAEKRAGLMAELESVSAELRSAVRVAINAGDLSELGAHKLTGVSRMAIRAWMGKTP